MNLELDSAVKAHLRSSEQLKFTLETVLASDPNSGIPSDTLANPRIKEQQKRILSVVTHWNQRDGREEGSVLIFKRASRGGLQIHRAYPILGSFSISVGQSQKDTPDPTSPTTHVHRSRSELTLKIKPQGDEPQPFVLVTSNVQSLQSVTAECRRLREIATSGTIDLRTARQPLHSRLSSASAGLPGDDVADIDIIREDWVRREALKAAAIAGTKGLRIRIGSFNVNGKTPSQDLSPWLRGPPTQIQPQTSAEAKEWIPPMKPVSPFDIVTDLMDNKHPLLSGGDTSSSSTLNASSYFFSSTADSDPDLLILGFQELDLSTEALLYTTSTLKEDSWVTAVYAGLGEKAILYQKLASKQLVGMLIVVIVKKSLASCFSDISFCAAGAGIMGIMGNKGATAIRILFTPPTSDTMDMKTPLPVALTFVNAHLAAFDEMTERRHYDFQELSRRMVFEPAVPTGASEAKPPGEPSSIYESDVLFWLGGEFLSALNDREYADLTEDLNYRLDLPDADVRSLLGSHSAEMVTIPTLVKYDQLKRGMRTEKAFAGFREHGITHLPTYRFASGPLRDGLGYDRKRKPAWTDRILYMCSPLPSVDVQQLSYLCHPEITMSDHKPISGDFYLGVSVIDQVSYTSAVDGLCRDLWGFEDVEARGTPKIKLQESAIELGEIFYQRPRQKTIEVQNIGDIPCVVRFVPADIDGSICPDWLHIEPLATLLPAHTSTTITLTASISNLCARSLNIGPRRLECTLILHTALGKDHFVVDSFALGLQLLAIGLSLTEHTCFANSLSRLTRLSGPIRTSHSTTKEWREGQTVNAPREVMRLINWLMEHVSGDEIVDQLFDRPAGEELVARIRECLDTGAEFPSSNDSRLLTSAFAQTLLQFFDGLTEPIVPLELHARCLAVRDRDEAFELLDEFPPASVNVWISLTAFLHYISQSHAPSSSGHVSSRRAEKLAAIFAPVLLRDPDDVDTQDYVTSPIGKTDFLLQFIR
ncbi:DNase I-like protein [Leucogyrophana mollusca]|uniref:DNase I-like protein n=1 Tax=Leucogyrophana mollusca TaxID=85980 RepID=A0ACB8BQZ1_9AGAM|nr:DNase I-like protein [Leucogyrophana mollusca]